MEKLKLPDRETYELEYKQRIKLIDKIIIYHKSIKSSNEEFWKPVEVNKNYLVSSYGRVYSIKTEAIMSCNALRGGYRSVGFIVDGIDKTLKVHQLVAKAFIPNVDDKIAVNHIDGNKLNNHASNLEWTTIAENNKHGYETGLNRLTKRGVHQLDLEGNIIATFKSLWDASIATKISDGHITCVCRGRSPTAGGYKWRYIDVNPNDGEIDTTGFVPIKDFPKYLISKEGIIYNPAYKKILKYQENNDGYIGVSLAHNCVKKSFLVHRLVAMHFIKEIPGKTLVNHKDGNKKNYHVDNLEWVTNGENVKHAHTLKLLKQKTSNNKPQTPKLL